MVRFMATVAVLALLGGCSAMLGLEPPELRSGPDAGSSSADAATSDATGYQASAVRFSGGTYLSYGQLAGVTNGPRGMLSVWLRFNGNDAHQQVITAGELGVGSFGGIGGIARQANNKFEVALLGCAGATLVDMSSASTYTASSGWIHLLASWDVTQGRAQLYVNDVADRAAAVTINNGQICYGANMWGVGGVTSATLDADVADAFVSLDTSLDLDSPTNRRLFISAAGKPVDLGTRCQTPLAGVVPTMCFTGAPATWATNKGTGNGFSTQGQALAVAPGSPSD